MLCIVTWNIPVFHCQRHLADYVKCWAEVLWIFFFPFNEFKKACTLNTYPKASLGPDPINTIMWKHYIGLYLFEWKFRHVLQCFLGRFMLSGLKAVLVLAANMTLGSLLLGRVSFHGIIHVGSLYANVRVNWSVWKMSFLSFQGANLIITKLPL